MRIPVDKFREDRDFIKQYRKEWYAKNKANRIKQIRKREQEILDWYRTYKRTLSCSKCPESDWRCVEFHHRDPSKKEFNICLMARRGISVKTILKEMSKCDVLCANCHRKITYQSL